MSLHTQKNVIPIYFCKDIYNTYFSHAGLATIMEIA